MDFCKRKNVLDAILNFGYIKTDVTSENYDIFKTDQKL
jgi:hypothetical protein